MYSVNGENLPVSTPLPALVPEQEYRGKEGHSQRTKLDQCDRLSFSLLPSLPPITHSQHSEDIWQYVKAFYSTPD